MTDNLAQLIALYLPQFHPVAENDEWWGKGFTEWTNVAKCKPLFPGHYQPHLPANLGFCDLRVAETREAQASLAREYGLGGFCYWHYWFHGQRLLERPFHEVLTSGRPDFPFCLAWANETWSRRWLGEEKEILRQQTYSPDDDVQHARWCLQAFADPRYIRFQGRPVFLIYRPTHLPDPKRTADIFRRECEREGVPAPFMLGINSHQDLDYRTLGFDGTVDFEPQLGVLPNPMADGLKIYDYVHARKAMTARAKHREYPVYPCVFVSWDNCARRNENGIVFLNSSPENFENGLREAVQSVQNRPADDRIVFVNAWNEWAEGNHLEPDQRHGLGYLEAIRRVNCRVPASV